MYRGLDRIILNIKGEVKYIMANTRNTNNNTKVETKVEDKNITVETKSDENSNTKIAELEKQVSDLMALVDKLSSNHGSNKVSDSFDPNRYITIISLYQFTEGLCNVFKANGRELTLRNFGEELTVPLRDFQEIVGKYRHLFVNFLMTLSDRDSDIAEYYSLPNPKNSVLSDYQLENLTRLPIDELEKIYKKVCDSHKSLILQKWTRGFWDFDRQLPNANPAYNDIAKINLLNELSDGGMETVITAISDKRKK